MNDWYGNLELPPTLTIPDRFICPITHTIMKDPVIGDDEKNYEYEAFRNWLKKKKSLNQPLTSPWTRGFISKTTIFNLELREEIKQWVKDNVEMAKAAAPSTTTASAKPASQTPARKTATGVAMAEAPVPSATAGSPKPAPQAPVTTTDTKMAKSPASSSSTMAASANPATPARKTATGEAMLAEAPVPSAMPAKPVLQALATTTAQAEARVATQATNTATDTSQTVAYLYQQNYHGRSLAEKILSQVSNF